MEDREHVRAVFSTANGKYGYREARRWVRPIFREDFCFKDDVEDLSQRLQQEFPKQCKLMTAADARHVETYFDPVDVQMQSHVFLHEVLMRIVFCNFEEARGRVQEYVNRVFLDPIRYERLKVEDLEIHVFSKEEQDLVGYDNTLPAALAILKQYKFPQGMLLSNDLVVVQSDINISIWRGCRLSPSSTTAYDSSISSSDRTRHYCSC